jgi:hypothetical protein
MKSPRRILPADRDCQTRKPGADALPRCNEHSSQSAWHAVEHWRDTGKAVSKVSAGRLSARIPGSWRKSCVSGMPSGAINGRLGWGDFLRSVAGPF